MQKTTVITYKFTQDELFTLRQKYKCPYNGKALREFAIEQGIWGRKDVQLFPWRIVITKIEEVTKWHDVKISL